MQLKQLLKQLKYEVLAGSEEIEITHLRNNSEMVGQGDVFVCLKGTNFDGHRFLSDVVQKGAVAVIVMNDIEPLKGITVIKVDNTRYALACMAAEYFGNPAERLITIGITGTKGKTTTTYMVRSVLESAGIKTGLIGTIETIIGEQVSPAYNTTPESYTLQKLFREMVDAGCRCVVMEVSSQALMLDRTSGFEFDYGIFTNIEPDHIGPNEHKDFEHYLQCKSQLLKQCKHGIINMDADFIDRVLEGHICDIETYGIDGDYDFTAKNISLFTKPGCLGVSYDLCGKLNFSLQIPMPGEFNVYNSLCAVAICSHLTHDVNKIKKALRNIRVKGRVELVPISKRFTLMIDYAHNAMSLESLLLNLKKYHPKRLVTVFGCGGNRARDRRFEMGRISSELSDLTIVTSDNPRFEEPMDIIKDILVGVQKEKGEYVIVPDRKEAIRYAILHAQDGDVIVLAGKGHEDYQEIRGVKNPMDERHLIAEIIQEEEVRKVL